MSRDIVDFKVVPIRTAAILTGSYVEGTKLEDDIWQYNQLVLYVSITLGSLTSVELKVEGSRDDSTYYQYTSVMTTSDTQQTGNATEQTFTASGNYRLLFPITDNFIKVSVKGTGTVTSSSCAIDAILAIR